MIEEREAKVIACTQFSDRSVNALPECSAVGAAKSAIQSVGIVQQNTDIVKNLERTVSFNPM